MRKRVHRTLVPWDQARKRPQGSWFQMATSCRGAVFLLSVALAILNHEQSFVNTYKMLPTDAEQVRGGPYETTILDSQKHSWGNHLNLTFTANVTVDTQLARVCLDITLSDAPPQQCPFPAFRARLTGVAIVNIPIDNFQYREDGLAARVDPAVAQGLVGCEWLPVPGKYHLEINLIHCSMNVYNRSENSGTMKKQCPVKPQPRDATDFSFHINTFQRIEEALSLRQAGDIFPYRAWVFAPRCPESTYEISASCTARASKPSMIRTKVQADNYESLEARLHPGRNVSTRFDPYVFLPVNRRDGTIDYSAHYTIPTYAPSVSDLTMDNLKSKLCFVGDSNGRFLFYQTKLVLSNHTFKNYGCHGTFVDHTAGNSWDKQMFFENIYYPENILDGRDLSNYTGCSFVFLSVGHWDAGYPNRRPTVPWAYGTAYMKLLSKLESVTQNTAQIVVLSNTAPSPGNRTLACGDWRVPPMIDAYNEVLSASTNRLGILSKFSHFSKVFFMDNRDITEPLWDEAEDWNHPCRHVFPVIVHRILELVKKQQ